MKKFVETVVKYIPKTISSMYRYGVYSGTIPSKKNTNLSEIEFLFFPDDYPRPSMTTSDYAEVAADFFVGEGNAPILAAENDPAMNQDQYSLFTQKIQAVPQPTTKPTYVYLLEEFDSSGEYITSRPQGQVGDCYANASSNYSLVALALSQLPKNSGNSQDDLKFAKDFGYATQFSRPILQYANQKYGLLSSKQNTLLQQGGDFWTAVLAAKDFMAPEDWVPQPIIYTYIEALTVLQTAEWDLDVEGQKFSVTPDSIASRIDGEGFKITQFSAMIEVNGEIPEKGTTLNFSLRSTKGGRSLGSASAKIFPKKVKTRLVTFKLDRPIKVVSKTPPPIEVQLTAADGLNISASNWKLKYVLLQSDLLAKGLGDLLLEAWAKKLGIGLNDAIMGFNSQFYELNDIQITCSNITKKDNQIARIRTALNKGNPVPVAINIYDNYVKAKNGMVPLVSKNPQLLGGHLNLIIGMVDRDHPRATKIFDYWAKQTNTKQEDLPEAIFFFMNSWGIGEPQKTLPETDTGSGPIGTSPYWVEMGADVNHWIPSSVYMVASTAFDDGMAQEVSYANWPKARSYHPKNGYGQNPFWSFWRGLIFKFLSR